MNLKYKFKNTASPPKRITYYDTDAQARSVCFDPGDGTNLFLHYSDLRSGAFVPEENGIMLTFTTHVITLQGRNLDALFNSFAVHRPRHVKAAGERYAAVEEEAGSVVTQIGIKNR